MTNEKLTGNFGYQASVVLLTDSKYKWQKQFNNLTKYLNGS